MAYTDKCCAVCDEYVEAVQLTSARWKRFAICNVGECCIHSKPLQGVRCEDLEIHIKYHRHSLVKGFYTFIDTDTGVIKRAHKSRFVEFDKWGREHPEFYEVVHSNLKHEGLFTHGGIFCSDKRKLRKVLRKLGVVGKINEIVK